MLELNKIYCGDCLEIMKDIDNNSIDAIITDPPYELGFMGKYWDASGIAYDIPMWQQALRVLKPGGYLLSFGGSRTYHRMACAIEDAGFEIRDMIEWIYGSGFPKSLDISKTIDKRGGKSVGWFGEWLRNWRTENGITQKEIAKLFPSKTGGLTGCVANWELGLNLPTPDQFNLICKTFNLPFENLEEAEREVIGKDKNWGQRGPVPISGYGEFNITAPTTSEAIQWQGWGTALKPAHEPICMARKPLSEKTVAENILKWGTGGINIDECRVEMTNKDAEKTDRVGVRSKKGMFKIGGTEYKPNSTGRFPANLIHDGSDEVMVEFPDSKGQQGDVRGTEKSHTGDKNTNCYGEYGRVPANKRNDMGSAARFFYCAKASKSERNMGCKELYWLNEKSTTKEIWEELNKDNEANKDNKEFIRHRIARGNIHPTVKPLAPMEYLVKLVTVKDAIILDPFCGSGSTLIACRNLGRNYIGIDNETDYVDIANKRIANTYYQQELIK